MWVPVKSRVSCPPILATTRPPYKVQTLKHPHETPSTAKTNQSEGEDRQWVVL